MNRDIEKAKELLAAGASLPAVVLGSMPAATAATLQRCAVAGAFDERLYNLLLRGAEGPALSDLVAAGYVERTSVAPRWHRVVDSLRGAAWSSWWARPSAGAAPRSVPPALSRFGADLAAYFDTNGEHVLELRPLLLADQAAARLLFAELYERADTHLDMGACRSLLDVLSVPEMAPLLQAETAQLVAGRAVMLQARGLWYREFHQTVRYLSRWTPEAAFEGLLRGDPARVLHLHSAGGMGKTMQLRWFVARRCVPHRIACAVLDFDLVDPATATRRPWLLMLECARQWSLQIPGNPFEELVGQYDPELRLLHFGPVQSELGYIDAEGFMQRFVAILGAIPSDPPVVLVLDTLEGLLSHPAAGLAEFLAVVADVLGHAPHLRLALSARYDVRNRVHDLAHMFPDVVHVYLDRFDAQQARAYLRTIRGVADPKVVDAAAEKAEGVPFTLALLADLLEANPETTRDLLRGPDVSISHLLERVIDRIEDVRLRWLICFGVVPRRLSLDFLTHVMAPLLSMESGGGFPSTADRQRELWEMLLDYAGSRSWVAVSPSQPDTVVFHDDVARPLRHRFGRHPVAHKLHQRAAAYYERRAAEDPDHWLANITDALYHRFHDSQADDAWRSALAHAWRAGGAMLAADLAADLLGPDYVDNWRPRQGATGEPLLSPQISAEAHLERARALSQQARDENLPASDPIWHQAETNFAAARQVLAGNPTVRLPPTAVAQVQANITVGRTP